MGDPNSNGQARVVTNGINGVTGQYDVAPLTVHELFARVTGIVEPAPAAHVTERGQRLQNVAFRGLPWGVDAHDVTRAGWALVFHADEDDAVRAAMRPLLEHRLRQIGNEAVVKQLDYHTGESATAWLARFGVAWHNVEPTKIPYYLLCVGSPERLPLDVMREIDSDYCVGLLHFETPAEYARYVASVIEYETAPAIRNGREVAYFATRHPLDDATRLSADWLVGPLANGMPAQGLTPAEEPIAKQLQFRQRAFTAAAATREALSDLIEGVNTTPSILFTATHGMVWPNGDAHQLPEQGALLCQNWQGFGSVARSQYFAASDVSDTARVHGMIAFLFACYGAGTPLADEYVFEQKQAPPAIAPKPFIAALPRRLLTHPNGGALACIGHVERAWGYSITSVTQAPQIRAFQVALAKLCIGHPVGLAVQEFNDKCATLSVTLTGLLGKSFQGIPIDDAELVTTWTERNDAAGYVVIGDPAVRLRANDLV